MGLFGAHGRIADALGNDEANRGQIRSVRE